MKAHQFISALDDARMGLGEDTAPIAAAPSHAPTKTAQWETPSTGKSKDEGERTGGEKDAIKKSDHSIPAPIAKAPSHAPTSTAQWKTSGTGSEDEGEKVDKTNVEENVLKAVLNAQDQEDIMAIVDEAASIQERGHSPGCKCGFCKNKGSFGKKDKGEEEHEPEKEEEMEESALPMNRRPMSATSHSARTNRHLNHGKMGFRHPAGVAVRPKASPAPYQPSMEALDTSSNPKKTIQQIADKLLDAPE